MSEKTCRECRWFRYEMDWVVPYIEPPMIVPQGKCLAPIPDAIAEEDESTTVNRDSERTCPAFDDGSFVAKVRTLLGVCPKANANQQEYLGALAAVELALKEIEK
jgi:hypothetical protein